MAESNASKFSQFITADGLTSVDIVSDKAYIAETTLTAPTAAFRHGK